MKSDSEGASTLVNHSYAHIQGYLNIYITRCRIFTGKRGGLGNLESCHRKKSGLGCLRQLPPEGDYCSKASVYAIAFFFLS